MFRTRLMQWITDRYPTRGMHGSRFRLRLYRLLLGLVRPRGRITLRTRDYRINFSPLLKDIAHGIVLHHPWEPFCSELFASLLKPGMRVYDIGANIGHYTLIAAREVGPGGRVEAFEPFPAHCADLAANVVLNGLENVTVHQLACGEDTGGGMLHTDAANSGGHSFTPANLARRGPALRVGTTTLDALARESRHHPPAHLIKMDTQGAEGAILRGGRETLRLYRPTLVMEFWPYGLKRAGESPAQVLELLTGLGYRLRNIDEVGGTLKDVSPEQLLAAYPETVDYGFTNLLATVD